MIRWPVAALALAGAAVQAQQEDPAALFTEVIEVRVVNIEVVVTDRDGVRVHGLEPSDFELLVDGEPVPIDFFTEIQDGVAREAGGDGVAAAPGRGSRSRGRPSSTKRTCSSAGANTATCWRSPIP